MEERYLFKAKREDNKEWIFGSYVYAFVPDEKSHIYGLTRENHVIVEKNGNIVLIDKDTLCQCTGLKDKNGNLIWENDIVNCTDEECCGYISWNESEAGFYFNVLLEGGGFEEEHIYDYQDCMEVIGNIFDNPELLERER